MSTPRKRTSKSKSKRTSSKNTQSTSYKRKSSTKSRSRQRTSSRRIREVTEQVSLLNQIEENYQKIKPSLLLFGVIISVYMALSLLSFRPADLIAVNDGGGTRNIGGILGLHLAHWFLSVFGYGAWVVVPVGGLFAWVLAGRSFGGWPRLGGWSGLLLSFLCVCSLLDPELTADGYYTGGELGSSIIAAMTWLIGPGGAWLLISGWSISMVLVVTGIDIRDSTNRWLTKIEDVGPSVSKRGFDFGRITLERLRGMGQGFWGMGQNFVSRFRSEDDDEWNDEDWYSEDDSLYIDDESFYTDDGLLIDDVDSIPPSSPFAEDDEDIIEKSFFGNFPEDDDLYNEPSMDFTRTRIQKNELVEVEWDPTIASDPGVAVEMREKTKRERKTFKPSDTFSMPSDTPKSRSREKRSTAKKTPDLQQSNPKSFWEEDNSQWYKEQQVADEEPNHMLGELDSDTEEGFRRTPQLDNHQSNMAQPVAPRSSFVSHSRPTPAPRASVAPRVTSVAAPSVAAPSVAEPNQSPASNLTMVPQATDKGYRDITLPPVQRKVRKERSKSTQMAASTEPPPAKKVDVNPGNLVSGGSPSRQANNHQNPYLDFELPAYSLLEAREKSVASFDEEELQKLAETLEEKLSDFGVKGQVSSIRPGPVITTFEYKPARGVKISKISSLTDDIAMALKAVRVRIVAPIPGKDVVGIEIPNKTRQVIWSTDMFCSRAFMENNFTLPMALGKTVEGLPYISDLAKMPHLLVGGTTGSGKSVGINTMILSLLFKHTPESLRFILIDPKMLEFEMYHDIPHLIHPVITDPTMASGILKWACDEMDNRYALMAKFKTRTIGSFNKRLEKELEDWDDDKAYRLAPLNWDGEGVPPTPKKMPYIVIIIDELADLMMVAGKEVEGSIIRLAQKARACGIHLIVATQRPSVDVITGMIKANMPCRVSFQVRQRTDSRTILDQNGGENLLGKGDMLFLPPGVASLQRCHGPFVTDDEVRRITDFLRAQGEPLFEAKITSSSEVDMDESEEYDELYDRAVAFIAQQGKASTSMIQRQFKIGYNRAARIIECMEREGVVGPQDGSRPRKVLVQPMD